MACNYLAGVCRAFMHAAFMEHCVSMQKEQLTVEHTTPLK